MKLLKKFALIILIVIIAVLCIMLLRSFDYYLTKDGAISSYLHDSDAEIIEYVEASNNDKYVIVILSDNGVYTVDLEKQLLWHVNSKGVSYASDLSEIGVGDVYIYPAGRDDATYLFGAVNNPYVKKIQAIDNGTVVSECGITDGQRIFTLGYIDKWIKGFEFKGFNKSGEVIWKYTY